MDATQPPKSRWAVAAGWWCAASLLVLGIALLVIWLVSLAMDTYTSATSSGPLGTIKVTLSLVRQVLSLLAVPLGLGWLIAGRTREPRLGGGFLLAAVVLMVGWSILLVQMTSPSAPQSFLPGVLLMRVLDMAVALVGLGLLSLSMRAFRRVQDAPSAGDSGRPAR